jgi:hypothetical protein
MRPQVRILIVTNDWPGVVNGGFRFWSEQGPSERTGPNSRQFHLGEFVRTLAQTPWLGFNVDITMAHRGRPGGGVTELMLKEDRGAKVVGFRFDEAFTLEGASRTLADYDMCLFFPINPSPDETAAKMQAEADAIAQFMENGGGFFATGDHAELGAPLCKLIPRVRSMRRWWTSPPAGELGAPPPTGAARVDTTRPGADGVVQFEDQSDEFAQEIEPAMYPGGLGGAGGYPALRRFPHPLLCSPEGVVRWLPDHMHEGMCEVPAGLGARTFTLGGASRREYPDYTSRGATAPLAPEIVAWGRDLGHTTPAINSAEHYPENTTTTPKRFGVIGAWDGHRVGRGRVVVDATWHHFFDINLTGDWFLDGKVPWTDQRLHGFYVWDSSVGERVPSAHYRMIQWYFRNLVYWLIPKHRRARIIWDAIAEIARTPRLLEELVVAHNGDLAPAAGARVHVERLKILDLSAYLYFGQLAEEYFRRARGLCAVLDLREILFKPKIPWWEWVMDEVDIWDPAPIRRGRPSEGRQLQRLAAMELAPRPDALMRAGLGAALVALAQVRAASETGSAEEMARQMDEVWPQVLERTVHSFREELKAGARLGGRFDAALAGRTAKVGTPAE